MKSRKTGIVWKVIFFLFLTSTIVSLLKSFIQAVVRREWTMLLLLFFILLLMVMSALRWIKSLIAVREEYRQRFLGQEVRLRDALLYGLSFSRDIYRTIPPERKKLVKYAFILIGLPFLIIAWDSRLAHFSLYLLSLLLVLAGVNILLWIMASEREEKERLKIELDTARQMQLSLMPGNLGRCCIGRDRFRFSWARGPVSLSVSVPWSTISLANWN